jgi:hypothetical protein
MTITRTTEPTTTVDSLPLRLSFEPDAIREHFDGDAEFAFVADLSDDELAAVGASALGDDRLYQAFHLALVDAVEEVAR